MTSAARIVVIMGVAAAVAACSTPHAPRERSAPARPDASRPGYYKDDGPPEAVPGNLDALPDAVPKRETLHRFANRPYVVFGREYVPATALRRYRERGIASWYGRKFHGQRTAIGEPYDMFAMSAAHPTLPLPSYARVTNVATKQSVIVRVNDRGPFLQDRVIDLSYAAAHRIGIASRGSGEVEVESIVFEDVITVAAAPLPSVASAMAAPSRGNAVTPAPVSASSEAITSPLAAAPIIVAVDALREPDPAPVFASEPTHPAGPLPLAAAERVMVPALSPSADMPVTPAPGGFVVQLGAFASYANAQSFIARLANQSVERRVEAQVRQVNGLFRVYVGPYATRDGARREAERLSATLGLPSTIALH